MRLVYKYACKTHAWLGESTDYSDLAIDLLKELKNDSKHKKDLGEQFLRIRKTLYGRSTGMP